MIAAIPRLESERLILRRWGRADRPAFAAINADARVLRYLVGPVPPAMSDAMINRMEAHFDVHGYGLWAVERRADGALLGFAGAQVVPFEAAFTPAVEVGWRLGYDYWGQGFATEAARLALADVVERVGIADPVSFTVPANRRSQRVMDKLGFVRDADGDFAHPRLPVEHPLSAHWLYRLRGAAPSC